MLPLSLTIIIALIILAFTFSYFYYGIFYDAPFIPSSQKAIQKILESAEIKKGNIIFDLGAGDGRLIHLATNKHHAKATGFEINPIAFLIAKIRQIFWKWQGIMKFKNFDNVDFSEADIIFCYLSPQGLKRNMDNFVEAYKKGIKIISYSFSIPGLEPIKHLPREDNINQIFIYHLDS